MAGSYMVNMVMTLDEECCGEEQLVCGVV